MARAIALGDTITTTGAVGDSGAGARIPAAESRAAGASTPAALTRLAVPILSVPPWRTTCSALWLSSLQVSPLPYCSYARADADCLRVVTNGTVADSIRGACRALRPVLKTGDNPAIPAEPPSPVITGCAALALRKL